MLTTPITTINQTPRKTQQDDGSPDKAWRNGLTFNPAQKYGGYSYNEIMLEPLADALRAALDATKEYRFGTKPKIYFSLQVGGVGGSPDWGGSGGLAGRGADCAELESSCWGGRETERGSGFGDFCGCIPS